MKHVTESHFSLSRPVLCRFHHEPHNSVRADSGDHHRSGWRQHQPLLVSPGLVVSGLTSQGVQIANIDALKRRVKTLNRGSLYPYRTQGGVSTSHFWSLQDLLCLV
ncbi:hypothetical protein J6590_017533 [Homalodisca vitripennis]|nr:hypothetical protein J6590_017533 [Homalodisca vitripennis]